MTLTDTYTLNNGVKIPVVGFGTWQSADGDEAYNAVKWALEAGYRHIDTAAIYGNEVSVGKAIADSGIPREELFVTTKLWATNSTADATAALDESLKKLGLDYVDLYLIHWPNPKAFRPNYKERNAAVWKAMEAAVRAGKARAIGISNFRQHHIDALLETAEIVPAVNQLFINPSDQQEDLVAYCREKGMLIEAYSPFGTGKMFEVAELTQLADKYGKTPAQILLAWSLKHGYLPLPKSVTESRIKANTEVFDIDLADSDVKLLDDLHGVAGLTPDPDTRDF